MHNEYIITPVKDFVEKAIKEKSFLPVDLAYPGFKISKNKSIALFAGFLQTKVLVNYSTQIYRSGRGSDYEFSDLVEADMAATQGKKDPSKQPLYEILEQSLPKDIARDNNLLGASKIQELSRKSLVFGLSHHVKASILDIDYSSFGPINEFSKVERSQILSQLAATLIYFKHNNPAVFKELQREIEKSPIKKAAGLVLTEITDAVPSAPTLQVLYAFDPKFTQEHYPKETAQFQSLDKLATRVSKKM